MVERIVADEELLAIIIRHEYEKDGIEFFTEDHLSQQLGYMKRPKGYQIAPHQHVELPRTGKQTQEVLFIKSGKLRADFFRSDRTYVNSCILQKGDVVLLITGGHGFEMLKETQIIEVKQGPYNSDADKVRF